MPVSRIATFTPVPSNLVLSAPTLVTPQLIFGVSPSNASSAAVISVRGNENVGLTDEAARQRLRGRGLDDLQQIAFSGLKPLLRI